MSKKLKAVLKVLFSVVALYYVFSQINWKETKALFMDLNMRWIFLALLAFSGSKLLSAFRLNHYFRALNLELTEGYNVRLYLIGMFYNLFLPGGIGGDGYKVYLLNKKFDKPVKPLIGATLLDRISGLYALLLLALALALFIDFGLQYENTLIIILILLSIPVYYLLNKLVYPLFLSKIAITTIMGLGVQLLQVVCAYFILLALSVSGQFIEYQFVFLISSVVAIFPFTIGGVGARELTFIFSHQYLGIDKNVAVAFSLIFFLITAVVSLCGMFVSENDKE